MVKIKLQIILINILLDLKNKKEYYAKNIFLDVNAHLLKRKLSLKNYFSNYLDKDNCINREKFYTIFKEINQSKL